MNASLQKVATVILIVVVAVLVVVLFVQLSAQKRVQEIGTDMTPESVNVIPELPTTVDYVPEVVPTPPQEEIVMPPMSDEHMSPSPSIRAPEMSPELPLDSRAENPEPAPFPATYISSVIWPPEITRTKTTALNCSRGAISVDDRLPDVTKRRVADVEYCIRRINDGAAGSLYAQYEYSTVSDGELIVASFTLRFPNCGAYDESRQSACFSEQTATDIDGLVHQYIQTSR